MKCANSICFSKDGRFIFHADTPTHRINVFPYSTDGTVGKPQLVKNYLVQHPAVDYATNARRLVSAFNTFLPQYTKFFSLVLFSSVLILSCIAYSGLIPNLMIGLTFLLALACGIKALPVQDCPDGSIMDSKD
jgi:hypothetical protein